MPWVVIWNAGRTRRGSCQSLGKAHDNSPEEASVRSRLGISAQSSQQVQGSWFCGGYARHSHPLKERGKRRLLQKAQAVRDIQLPCSTAAEVQSRALFKWNAFE